MPAHKVPAQTLIDRQRPFEIHAATGFQFAQVGPGKRFRSGLKGERIALPLNDRQAATVHGNTVSHIGVGGDFRLADN